MSERVITADELFGEFQNDPKFEAERRRLTSRTNLAINVNRLRNERGWTQEKLAREAGMKQPRIAEIERGDANPQLDTITRVAMALGVNDGDLLVDPEMRDGRDVRAQVTLSVVLGGGEHDRSGWSATMRMQRELEAINDNFALAG